MKHIFIVNPTSGKGKALNYIPAIEEYFSKNGGEYIILQTEYPRHATELASKYHAEDDVRIYCCGGDGTMKEVLDGLDLNVPMCVIPGGTGNDFYKSIDNRDLTFAQRLAESVEGEEIKIDYGVFDGKQRFMNIISFGLDADINIYACDYVKKELNIPDKYTYLYSTFKVGLHPQAFSMDMIVDGKKYHDKALLVAIANGRYYGGMFKAAPNAKLEDGKFDLCYFQDMSVPKMIGYILKYAGGKHLGLKKCVSAQGKNIEFKFSKQVNYQIDGENFHTDHCSIQLVEKGIKLVVPKNRQL